MRILLAEDDQLSLRLLSAQLERLGYQVIAVDNGMDAMAVLQQADPPRLAILDWMMPCLDGTELCRRLRSQSADRYTYVLLLTSRGRSSDIVTGLDAGADDYVAKPVVLPELAARLRAGQRILALQDQLLSAQAQLRLQATRDALTGLWNRRAIFDLLHAAEEQCAAGKYSLAVVLCDIDHFKSINDRHGHPAGDAVLAEVAGRLAQAVRQEDAVGRYGGEEFLLVIPGVCESVLPELGERIRLSICSTAVGLGQRSIRVSISLGGAFLEAGVSTSLRLLDSADQCLLQAKRAGRNCVQTTVLRQASAVTALRAASS